MKFIRGHGRIHNNGRENKYTDKMVELQIRVQSVSEGIMREYGTKRTSLPPVSAKITFGTEMERLTPATSVVELVTD